MKNLQKHKKYWFPVVTVSLLFAIWMASLSSARESVMVFLIAFIASGVILGAFAYVMWINIDGYHVLSFPLQRGGKKRLSVRWKGTYKHISITIDDALAGTLEKIDKYNKGATVSLFDGSELFIKPGVHPVNQIGQHLELRMNGEPVPGSLGDPVFELESASRLFMIASLAPVLIGIASMMDNQPAGLLALYFIDFIMVITCAILLRRQSRAGLWFGIFLVSISILSIIVTFFTASGEEVLGLITELLNFYLLGVGLKRSYAALKKQKDMRLNYQPSR